MLVSAHMVIEIVNDDMPFLVYSVATALRENNCIVHIVTPSARTTDPPIVLQKLNNCIGFHGDHRHQCDGSLLPS